MLITLFLCLLMLMTSPMQSKKLSPMKAPCGGPVEITGGETIHIKDPSGNIIELFYQTSFEPGLETLSSIHYFRNCIFLLLLFLIVYLYYLFKSCCTNTPFMVKEALAYLIQLSFLLAIISGVLLAVKIRLAPDNGNFSFFSLKMLLLIFSAYISLPYLKLEQAGAESYMSKVQARTEISFHNYRKILIFFNFIALFTLSLLMKHQ